MNIYKNIYVKCVVFIIAMFIFMPSVNAICDNEKIMGLKELAKNIEITYELDLDGKVYTSKDKNKNFSLDNNGNEVPQGNMKVIISGMNEQLVLNDKTYNRTFKYTQSDNGIIIVNNEMHGSRQFVVYSNICNKAIRNISIKIPRYNEYSTSPLCKGIDVKKLPICGTWYEKEVDYKTFEKMVKDYKNKPVEVKKNNDWQELVEFLEYYYLYILIPFIAIIAIIAILVIRRKRSELE